MKDTACTSEGMWFLGLGLWASGSAPPSAAGLTSNVWLLLSRMHMCNEALVMALQCQSALGRAVVAMRLLSISRSLAEHTDLALRAVKWSKQQQRTYSTNFTAILLKDIDCMGMP